MELAIQIIHIVVSLTLLSLIMLQTEGSSLGGASFGGGEVFRSKRGSERFLFILTIIMGIVFVATSTGNVVFGP